MRALLLLLLAAASLFAAEKRLPGETPVTAPRGGFTITQSFDERWHTTVHFKNPNVPSIVLADGYPWPGSFYVSPDDRWFLHIQKSGSGDNISFLYGVEASGRLWRMEPPFGAAAFTFLERSEGLSTAHLYHTGIDFVRWDIAAGLLRFSIHGSDVNVSGKGFDRRLIYDLKKHTFRAPKP